MKSRKTVIVFAIALLGLVMTACDPDLVVPTIQSTGPPNVKEDGRVVLPIRVVVTNAGTATAGRFKVAAQYTDPGGPFAVAFPVGSDLWYPIVSSLSADSSIFLQGNLNFGPWARGKTVSIRVTADSCSGDEFMPDYCRVEESNESNNTSGTIVRTLP